MPPEEDAIPPHIKEGEPAIEVVTKNHQVKKMNPHPTKQETEFDLVDKLVTVKKVIPDQKYEAQAESSLHSSNNQFAYLVFINSFNDHFLIF